MTGRFFFLGGGGRERASERERDPQKANKTETWKLGIRIGLFLTRMKNVSRM